MKNNVSQKIDRNMTFSVYSVKMVFLFSTNMILPFCQKAKMIFSQKNTLKDDIFVYHLKDGIYPSKLSLSSDRKIKVDKKFYFYKKVPVTLCTFMEIFIGIFINYFPMKETSKLNI